MCYDSIPKGKYAFEKKIVSSCDDKYTYENTCVISCGDKYKDENLKTCYDSVPSGMFLDGNKIVSSCGEKYTDGQLCVPDCITRPENNIIEGKTCIKECDKYLHFSTNNDFECKDSCNYYYINDKFKRMGTNTNYCISPNLVPVISMNNLFIFGKNQYVFDLSDEDNEKIFLKKKVEDNNTPNRDLFPLVLKGTDTSFLRKFEVSPDGTTYGVMYNDHIDLYRQDIFNNESFTSLRVNSPLSNATFERCFIYDNSNLIILLKGITNDNNIEYKLYHVVITNFEESLVQYFQIGSTFTKQGSNEVRLYSAVQIDNENYNMYHIGYTDTFTDANNTTKDVYVISYNFQNNLLSSQQQPIKIDTFDTAIFDVLDVKISKDLGVIFVYNKTPQVQNLEMRFINFSPFPITTSVIDKDNTINSYPIAITKNNKAYYAKYNTDKSISIYEATYDDSNQNNIPTFSNIYTFTGPYENDVYVSIASNLEGTYLLCVIQELNENNVVLKKELRQVDLTSTPETDTLILSS
jgi:hypothetical protein